MAVDFNSPSFFRLVSRGSWPTGDEALDVFFALDRDDVDAIVKVALKTSPRGRTWAGLQHLMDEKRLTRVREMGEPAALVWARHLGVVDPAGDEPDRYEAGVGA